MQNKTCMSCGEGKIISIAKAGRILDHKGIPIPVPAELSLPTCTECKEEFIGDNEGVALDKVIADTLMVLFLKLLDSLDEKQSELEDAIGLSQGYFSKIKQGRKPPTLRILKQLNAFRVNPKIIDLHNTDHLAALLAS